MELHKMENFVDEFSSYFFLEDSVHRLFSRLSIAFCFFLISFPNFFSGRKPADLWTLPFCNLSTRDSCKHSAFWDNETSNDSLFHVSMVSIQIVMTAPVTEPPKQVCQAWLNRWTIGEPPYFRIVQTWTNLVIWPGVYRYILSGRHTTNTPQEE